MSKRKILLIFAVLALVLCALIPCLCLSARALENPEDMPEIEGVRAYFFYNMTSEKLIASQNANVQISTSTSAKVMTGLLLCERLELRLNESVQISEEMIDGVPGRKYGFKAGDTATLRDILYAAICGSYNDAAYIAVRVAYGSDEEFVSLMNTRAAEYGATMTHYTNPLGFPVDDTMLTTASDVSKIARHAYSNTMYMEMCSARHYTMGDGTEIYNYNLLVCSSINADYYGKYYEGMNAGSTDSENWSVVTVASDDDQKYLCVVLGGYESDGGKNYAYATINKLVRWAFNEYKTDIWLKKGYVASHIPVELTGISKSNATVIVENDLIIHIPKDAVSGDIQNRPELYYETLKAPVEAGQVVGVWNVYYDGEIVGTCNLVIKEDFEANPILSAVNVIAKYMGSRAFIITLITIAVLLPCVILYIRKRNHRNGYKKYKT